MKQQIIKHIGITFSALLLSTGFCFSGMAATDLPASTQPAQTVNTEQNGRQILENMTDEIASLMGIETPEIVWESKDADTAAIFVPQTRTIVLNPDIILKSENPTDTLIHELRHAYQYDHMDDGTPESQAWKDNIQEYIEASDNFAEHITQPLEADAIAYVGAFYEEHKQLLSHHESLAKGIARKLSQNTVEEKISEIEPNGAGPDAQPVIIDTIDITDESNNPGVEDVQVPALTTETGLRSKFATFVDKLTYNFMYVLGVLMSLALAVIFIVLSKAAHASDIISDTGLVADWKKIKWRQKMLRSDKMSLNEQMKFIFTR